jgi:ribose 5-phosphate isomerase B
VRIAIASDHAGYRLKEHLKDFLKSGGHDVQDLGTHSEEPVDYPDLCAAAARVVEVGSADRAVLVGGSGQGEQIVANKIHGIRAALCNDLYTARLSRAHNDANVVTLGARIIAVELAREILTVWLSTPFEGGRHARRIGRIGQIERGEA